MTSPEPAIFLDESASSRLAEQPFIATIARHVARKWAGSFGLGEGPAMTRLEDSLASMARETLVGRDGLVDFESALDEAAFRLTAGWLEAVLGAPVGTSAQSISAARLAFLIANADGAWSDRFLDPAGPHGGLRAAMQAASFVATPPVALREIARQAL